MEVIDQALVEAAIAAENALPAEDVIHIEGQPHRALELPGNINARPEQHYLGPRNQQCAACHALFFPSEPRNRMPGNGHARYTYLRCCRHGKVQLEPLEPMPRLLQELYSGRHEKSQEFLLNIKSYNGLLQFSTYPGAAADRHPPGEPEYVRQGIFRCDITKLH